MLKGDGDDDTSEASSSDELRKRIEELEEEKENLEENIKHKMNNHADADHVNNVKVCFFAFF